jgi:hypothetical protein
MSPVPSQPTRKRRIPHWHRGFLRMLPVIHTHARVSFLHLDPEAREEAIAECAANALVAYVRLYQAGKVGLAYPTVLARYAVAQVNDGRKVGNRMNVQDVSSEYCQRRKGIVVERLDKFDQLENAWQEIVVEDRHAGPAEVAATRLDFAAYLRVLPGRLRKIAKVLATGETTTATARRFNLCPGRISQIRKELFRAWQRFQGEVDGCPVAA